MSGGCRCWCCHHLRWHIRHENDVRDRHQDAFDLRDEVNVGYWWRSRSGDWFLDHGSDFISYHDSDGCGWDRRAGGFACATKLGCLHIDLLPETSEITFGLVQGCKPATFFQDGCRVVVTYTDRKSTRLNS